MKSRHTHIKDTIFTSWLCSKTWKSRGFMKTTYRYMCFSTLYTQVSIFSKLAHQIILCVLYFVLTGISRSSSTCRKYLWPLSFTRSPWQDWNKGNNKLSSHHADIRDSVLISIINTICSQKGVKKLKTYDVQQLFVSTLYVNKAIRRKI